MATILFSQPLYANSGPSLQHIMSPIAAPVDRECIVRAIWVGSITAPSASSVPPTSGVIWPRGNK